MSTEISQHPLHVSLIHNKQHQQLQLEESDRSISDTCQAKDNATEDIAAGHRSDVPMGKGAVGGDCIEGGDYGEQELQQSNDDLITTINKLQDSTKSFFAKWLEELSPSEEFEILCPARVDQLLKEAYSLEDSLLEHKRKIQSNLTVLNSVLKVTK